MNVDEQLNLYKCWAPDNAMWTQWAKPVVFMNINFQISYKKMDFNHIPIAWTNYNKERMLIVDLAGVKSVQEGVALIEIGYRPVPLYNGVPGGPKPLISVQPIVDGLRSGEAKLMATNLTDTANPAFLLDSQRLQGTRKKGPGTFDNRWCVVAQDLPSANYLRNHGIREILVRTDHLNEDLQYLLYSYQKQGIKAQTCDKKGEILISEIPKPRKLGLFYRFLLLIGFSRSSTGGFGMSIPEVSSGGGGYRAG